MNLLTKSKKIIQKGNLVGYLQQKAKVLDTVMRSFEVGLYELFVQSQVDVQVPHEQFENGIGIEAGFEPEVLDEGGGLEGLVVFYVPDGSLVDEEVLVVESHFGMGGFRVCSLDVYVLDSWCLFFEHFKGGLDFFFTTSNNIRLHHIMQEVDPVSFGQVFTKDLLAEFKGMDKLAQTVVYITQDHSDTAPELTLFCLEFHMRQLNLFLGHFRDYRL